MAAVKKRQKRKVASSSEGRAYIRATFNNVMVTITDKYGAVLSWSTAGKNGFRGSKKNTPYAAQVSAEKAAKEAYDMGIKSVKVFVKGPGSGREAAIRVIDSTGIKVESIVDRTPIPHNGCRPPKRRRV